MKHILSLTLTLSLTLAAVGCHRPARCAPGEKSKLEVRNGSGALMIAWKTTGDLLCDGNLVQVGTLKATKDTVTLRDAAGRLKLELTRESPEVARGRDQEGPHLRLYRDVRELRVLRADGVPLGSVAPQTTTGAIVYNPSSSPLARSSIRDRDAVITDLAGTAQTYVRPAKDATAAGVFGVPSLDPTEQLALYIYSSR
ncbi:MAG TPA: hypothetical protein VHB97_04610 [Polyangia bacterium]|nr:hypothetical protein [Polyangia bacterium]